MSSPMRCSAVLAIVITLLAGSAMAGTTRLVVGLREMRATLSVPNAGMFGDEENIATHVVGAFDHTSNVATDPTPDNASSGDESTARLRQTSTVSDAGVSLTGDYDFHIGAGAATGLSGLPAGNVFSDLSAVWEVSGGNVRVDLHMTGSTTPAAKILHFQLQDVSTNKILLERDGDGTSAHRLLTPGQYRIGWEFVESTNTAGTIEDGTHSFDVKFTDAGPGTAIPLPPAALSALAAALVPCAGFAWRRFVSKPNASA